MKKGFIFTCVVLLFSWNVDLKACQCMDYYSLDSLRSISFEDSDIVFLGELVANDTTDYSYEFLIYELFKGDFKTTRVKGKYFSSCSMYPSDGKMWLIYGRFEQDSLIDINQCLASRSFDDPMGYLYVPPPPPPPNQDYKTDTCNYYLLDYELKLLKTKQKAFIDLIEDIEYLRFNSKIKKEEK
jgi:hypothetical protein